ncbi:MAG: hypothetical protein WCH07_09250 [Deltaproteobacteria bacterium]
MKTNFDKYLEEHLKDKNFAERFKKADEKWDKILSGDITHDQELHKIGGCDDT